MFSVAQVSAVLHRPHEDPEAGRHQHHCGSGSECRGNASRMELCPGKLELHFRKVGVPWYTFLMNNPKKLAEFAREINIVFFCDCRANWGSERV